MMNDWKMSCWLAFIVFGLLPGCVTFHPRPIEPLRIEAEFRERTLTDSGLRAYVEAGAPLKPSEWPPSSWDFTLLTLVAFYYHPDLDVARTSWSVTEARVVTAAARPNPSVNVAPGYASNAGTGIPPWLMNFFLDIPVETAGKRGYRIAQAVQLSAAARLHIATVAWQVRSRLRKSLLDLYSATQIEALLNKQQTVQEEIVTLLEQRLAAGEISQPEVTLAHLALDQTRLSLREVQKQRAEARGQLAEALGFPVAVLDGVAISFAGLDQLPPDLPTSEVRGQALLNRPDLLAALAEYAASESALQLEIARQYPDFHTGPGYERDTGENKWFLGLSLVLPVLNRNAGPIAEAEARRKETAARFTALQAQVIGEIDRALAGYHAALQTVATADALLSAHIQQYESTQAMFHVGEADRLALLSAHLEREVSARARLNALVTAQRAFGLLEDAVQRPLNPLESTMVVPEKRPRSGEENNG